MTRRLNIVLDEIVLHGSSPPDPRVLERQLSEALAGRVTAVGAGQIAKSDGMAVQIAQRIAAVLPPSGRGDGRR